jgi:Polysaccharide lyase family 4, domain II
MQSSCLKLAVTPSVRASSPGVSLFRAVVWLAAVAVGACGPAESAPRAGAQDSVKAAATTVATPGYTVVPLKASGTLVGTVSFDGPSPTDSITHPAVDTDVCGHMLMDPSVLHRGPRLQGAIVWLNGITEGKRLPYTRRYDLLTESCRVTPRVQAAIVGGTLNVRSADAVTHRTRFMRGADTVAAIQETEEGQVVPTERVLSGDGLIEVLCDMHPWSRAWLMVFRHPYFATTDANGAFTIDSVPPGRYQVSVWHERFGVMRDSVTITAGGRSAPPVALTFRGPAPGHPATAMP